MSDVRGRLVLPYLSRNPVASHLVDTPFDVGSNYLNR